MSDATLNAGLAPASALAARLGRLDALDVVTALFGVGLLLVVWSQAEPFKSLQDFASLDDPTQGSASRKVVTLGLVGLSLALVLLRGQGLRLLHIASLPLVAVFAWYGATALLSQAPGLAINRLALAGFTILIAGCLPLLFRRLDVFIAVLGAAASIAVAVSYAGALFAPDLAIHSMKDVYGHDLTGNWRGLFAHKNELAAMVIHFALIGGLLARTRHPVWGVSLAAASLGLLVLSGGKTAMLLFVPAVAAGSAVMVLRRRWLSASAVVAVVAGLLLLTLGTLLVPALAALTASAIGDPTFTGRTDIWDVALKGVAASPILGYGYAVFWDSGRALALVDRPVLVFDAHNGYLEAALSGGLVGLGLVLAWAGIGPWRAIERLKGHALDATQRAFLAYAAQAWVFTLLVSAMESVLFNRGQSVWFTGALVILCLRHWDRQVRP